MAKIAFVIPDLTGGGAERVALNLIHGFADAGHEVDLVLMEAKGVLLSLLSDRVRVVDLKAPRLRNALIPLIRYLRRECPDAMQISMWPLTVIGIAAARLSATGVRVVTSDHSTLSEQYSGRPWTRRLLKWTTALFYPRADAVVAVSNGVANDLAELSGLPRARISVIPNPVPVPPPNPAADRSVEPIWKGARHRILAVGSFKPEKNFDLLLDALARLDRAGDWSAVLLGEGQLRPALEEKARALGLADRVAMPGFFPDPAPFYRTATHFVLSSDFEGQGLVLVEALHAGLSIVSTDCPHGPREILGEAGGILVPVRDPEAMASALAIALNVRTKSTASKALGFGWSGEAAIDDYLAAMKVGESVPNH